MTKSEIRSKVVLLSSGLPALITDRGAFTLQQGRWLPDPDVTLDDLLDGSTLTDEEAEELARMSEAGQFSLEVVHLDKDEHGYGS